MAKPYKPANFRNKRKWIEREFCVGPLICNRALRGIILCNKLLRLRETGHFNLFIKSKRQLSWISGGRDVADYLPGRIEQVIALYKYYLVGAKLGIAAADISYKHNSLILRIPVDAFGIFYCLGIAPFLGLFYGNDFMSRSLLRNLCGDFCCATQKNYY